MDALPTVNDKRLSLYSPRAYKRHAAPSYGGREYEVSHS